MRKAAKKQRLTQQQNDSLKNLTIAKCHQNLAAGVFGTKLIIRFGRYCNVCGTKPKPMSRFWQILNICNHQFAKLKVSNINGKRLKHHYTSNKSVAIFRQMRICSICEIYIRLKKTIKACQIKVLIFLLEKANTLLFAEYGASETIYRYALGKLLQQFVAYQNTNFSVK